ncbi:MAG: hypothetical protein AAB300_01140 [Nitrospirota bacterium]
MSSTSEDQKTVQESSQADVSQVIVKGLVSKGQVSRTVFQDTHRGYTAESILRVLKLLSPKDLEKQARALGEASTALSTLKSEGVIREIAPNLFKVRLYVDEDKRIEHAYIGGMGNTLYRFDGLIFRFNIGVISVLFVRNEKDKNWRVSVADPTIGKNYSLVKPLHDGVHAFGTAPEKVEGKIAWVIDGKYIAKSQMTLTLTADHIEVEDHRSPRGTRIDHLTDEGHAAYLEVADAFLKSTDAPKDSIKRGRFVLEQLLNHHKDFELSFFNAAVSFLLLKEAK